MTNIIVYDSKSLYLRSLFHVEHIKKINHGKSYIINRRN